MSSGILAESFNSKQMAITSDVDLTKRQNDRIARLAFDMSANSNNSNNRGNSYSNIDEVCESVKSTNPPTISISHSSTLPSSRLKQERDFVNQDFANHEMASYVDSDPERNEQIHDRRFRCEHCGNSFTDPSNLQRHIRQHHAGARAHPCPECGKTFATSSGLKQHQHIHSSIKPFTCEVCRKSYTQFSNLCRHKRMHADCRVRIKCVNCGDFFPTSSALNKHRRFCNAKSLFPERTKLLEYGAAPGNTKISHTNKVDGSPPHLFRDNFRHFGGTSFLDFAPGRNPTPVINNQVRHGTGANSEHLPYLFSYPFQTSGPQQSPRESDITKEKLNPSNRTSPAPNNSLKTVPEVSTASVQIQCNDPLTDCFQMSLSKNNRESPTILRADSSRFRRVERTVKYSPNAKHSEVQISPRPSQPSPPHRLDVPSSSAFCPRSEMIGGSSYSQQNYSPFAECQPPQVSQTVKPRSDMFQGAFADNFKRILDEMIERQKFFSLASAFAKTPSFYQPGAFLTGEMPYPSYPFPQCHGENEQPLDLSLNRLRNELGFPQKMSTLLGEKSPQVATMQKLNSPVEAFEDGVPDIRRLAWPSPLYSPYGFLKGDPSLLRFYGGLQGSLPIGKVSDSPTSYNLPTRPAAGTSHAPVLSPSRMFMMLNSQRRMYDLLQRDYAGLNKRRTSNQGGPEHSPNPNFGGIPRSYGVSSQYGSTRGHGRYDREKYVCKYCGKLFPRSANLTRHLRTHTGEQPYSCKYCDRNFSISSNLQRHVRNIHKKERPYCCPLCKRAFGQQTNLERHLRKHLEKPESMLRGNLSPSEHEIMPSNTKVSNSTREEKDRNSLSPRHSNGGRSSDWNEEQSSRNVSHTSSDEESFDNSIPISTSFSPNQRESPQSVNNDSLNIVSSEE